MTGLFKFIRLFGSDVRDLKKARDIDLVVGHRLLSVAELSQFCGEMEEAFGKPVDIIQLRPGLGPTLVREIAKESVSLWRDKTEGMLVARSMEFSPSAVDGSLQSALPSNLTMNLTQQIKLPLPSLCKTC